MHWSPSVPLFVYLAHFASRKGLVGFILTRSGVSLEIASVLQQLAPNPWFAIRSMSTTALLSPFLFLLS